MRTDSSIATAHEIFEIPAEIRAIKCFLNNLIHPPGTKCQIPDASIIAALQECQQTAEPKGEMHLYFHHETLSFVCRCPCEKRPCLEFFALNEFCRIPQQHAPQDTAVVDFNPPNTVFYHDFLSQLAPSLPTSSPPK